MHNVKWWTTEGMSFIPGVVQIPLQPSYNRKTVHNCQYTLN